MASSVEAGRSRRENRGRENRGRFGNNNTFAISATDRWISNNITRALLSTWRDQWNIVALTNDCDDRHVRQLKQRGADVREINYGNTRDIERDLRDVDWLLFIAEANHDRVEQAQELARAANNAGVSGVIVLSLQGADRANTKTHRDYHEIERIWKDEIEGVTVVRISLLHESVWLWSQNIKENGELNWTLDQEDDEFAPISLDDVVDVIENLVAHKNGNLRDEPDQRDERQTYTLTGRDTLRGADVVDIINSVISGEVEYREVNRQQLENYLESLEKWHDRDDREDRDDDRESRRRSRRDSERQDGRFDRDNNRRGNQRRGRFDDEGYNYQRPYLPLRRTDVQLILDTFDFIQEGYGRSTRDVREITGRDPEPLYNFFEENKEDFETERDGGRFGRGRRGDYGRGRRDWDDEYGRGRGRRDRDDGYGRGRRDRDDGYGRGRRDRDDGYGRGRRNRGDYGRDDRYGRYEQILAKL
ncbi:hypothetical protein G9A89_007134 [Geosiphon pyriformis]|nr:hypothetical protein G9A89_007134 [Geosiphon pyriformis]